MTTGPGGTFLHGPPWTNLFGKLFKIVANELVPCCIACLCVRPRLRKVTVHGPAGDWSIFRPKAVIAGKNESRKHGPVPLPAEGDSPIFAAKDGSLQSTPPPPRKLGQSPVNGHFASNSESVARVICTILRHLGFFRFWVQIAFPTTAQRRVPTTLARPAPRNGRADTFDDPLVWALLSVERLLTAPRTPASCRRCGSRRRRGSLLGAESALPLRRKRRRRGR